MASTADFLLTGGVGQVFAWSWEDIGRRKAEPVWCVDVRGDGGRCEINWMVVTKQGGTDGQLVVAAGDNNVHLFDLETRTEVQLFYFTNIYTARSSQIFKNPLKGKVQ